jgi:hypothetical protein
MMSELKQHAWLLFLIAILVIAKFFVIPIFDWQNAVLSEITLLEKKQNKISNVLEQQDDNAKANAQLSLILTEVEQLFFPSQTEAIFKLEQQKVLESLLNKHNLNSENIGWQATNRIDLLDVIRYSIQIRFTGQSTDTIEFITALEANKQRIEVVDFNLTLKGQRAQKLGRMNASVTLFFYVNSHEKQHSFNGTSS